MQSLDRRASVARDDGFDDIPFPCDPEWVPFGAGHDRIYRGFIGIVQRVSPGTGRGTLVNQGRAERLCVVLPDLGAGGAQTVASWLVQQLSHRGVVCTVVQTKDQPRRFHQLDAVAEVISVPPPPAYYPGVLRAALRARRLRRILRARHPDTVLAMVGATNVIAILAGLGSPWRTVISERNDPDRQRLAPGWEWLRRRAYRWADGITANTDGAASAVRRWSPGRPVHVIQNAVEIPEGDDSRPAGRCIVNVGRLHHQKAQDVLVAAWGRVADRYPDWRLVVVGDGELRGALRQQAADLGVADRVDWLGHVRDVGAVLDRAGIFALPSRYEGTPNALLEAMAHGLPGIVTDASPGPLEFVRHGHTGWVVKADDVAGLAAALEQLLGDPALRRKLGEAARERVRQNQPARILEQWQAVLFPPEREVDGYG